MRKVIILNKKEGETPLETLESFRNSHKGYKDVSMTYAGRLDPMASGVLVILAGNATREKEKYLNLSKEYDFDVLHGFSTDTHDVLGKVTNSFVLKNFKIDDLENKIKNNLKFFTGKFTQKYPMYSSKTVKGKSLFTYARNGEVVESPEHEVEVKNLEFLKTKKISNKRLLESIERRVSKVKGDFRQKEIIKIWKKNLKNNGSSFYITQFKIKCGSGTYVRSIASSLGEKIGIPSLALTIVRTKVGKWSKKV